MNKMKWFLAATVGALMLQLPTTAHAFGCPTAIGAAQAMIDKVKGDMKSMEGKMTDEQKMLVHALLDDAKQHLAGAEHNHEKSQGTYDHARAIGKAGAALAYADAADVLHQAYMK